MSLCAALGAAVVVRDTLLREEVACNGSWLPIQEAIGVVSASRVRQIVRVSAASVIA